MASRKEAEKRMKSELNDFMGKYGIKEISFGKRHSLKRTELKPKPKK